MDCCHSQAHAADHQPTAASQPPRRHWNIALAIIPVAAAISVAAVALTRPNGDSPRAAAKAGVVTARSSGSDQVSDDGPGSVTASAKFERTQSTDKQVVFTLDLNTHSVDLSSFNPLTQVRLRQGKTEIAGQLLNDPGQQASHHKSFVLAWPRPAAKAVTLVVANVAGVAERGLPFTL